MSENKVVDTARLIVDVEWKEDKRVYFYMKYPHDQKPMPVKSAAHLLVGAICTLIRGCDYNDVGVKGHELLTEVVDHLEQEFVNVDSFEDVFIDTKITGDE